VQTGCDVVVTVEDEESRFGNFQGRLFYIHISVIFRHAVLSVASLSSYYGHIDAIQRRCEDT
jgi:hypothetical protein